jgi:hypothetical protein
MHFARSAPPTAPRLKFCIGIVLIIFLNIGAFAQEIQKGQSFHNQQELRVKAQELLESDSVVRVPPDLTVRDGVLRFYFGKVYLKTAKEPELARDPVRIPLEAELQIVFLRQYLATWPEEHTDFWTPYLNQADSAVSRMLDDLRSLSGNQLLSTLKQRQGEIDSALNQAVEVYASQKHLRLQQNLETRGKQVTVRFRSSPAGAEIQLVDDFLYRSAGSSLDDHLWLDVSSGNKTDLLVGDWQMRTRWSHSAPWQYRLVSVTRDGDFPVIEPSK